MKLHAFYVEAGVFDTHDLAVIRPRGHFQASRAGGALDRQRVVAVHREVRRQVGEHTFLGGADGGCFAVHELLRSNDLAAKRRANCLMAQTDPQNG